MNHSHLTDQELEEDYTADKLADNIFAVLDKEKLKKILEEIEADSTIESIEMWDHVGVISVDHSNGQTFIPLKNCSRDETRDEYKQRRRQE